MGASLPLEAAKIPCYNQEAMIEWRTMAASESDTGTAVHWRPDSRQILASQSQNESLMRLDVKHTQDRSPPLLGIDQAQQRTVLKMEAWTIIPKIIY